MNGAWMDRKPDRAKRILLVEDEAIIALKQKAVLEENGYGVLTSQTGEEAIRLAESANDIDLVLMDIDLGHGIDGTEAAERILHRCKLPVVFLSSHSEPEVVEKTERITSYGYILKSAGDTVLLTSLKMAFRLFDANSSLAKQSMKMEAANEELRVTNEELQSNNDKLRWWEELVEYVVQHDPSAIAILDHNLEFLYVSDRFARDYGVEHAAILGRHHYDVFPEIPQKWRNAHKRALKGEVVRSSEDFFERTDGTVDHTRWECRPWYTSDGAVGGIILYTEVINEQRRAMDALRESELRWQFALEGAGDGIWDWDASTGRVFFSSQWKSMLGFEDHEIGDTLSEWDTRIHPEDYDRVYETLNRYLRGESEEYVCEHRIKCRDGSYKWILDRGKIVSSNPDGSPARVIGTHTDISRQKAVEARIRKLASDKDTLLRESHHRVKNAFASVENLLTLKQRAADNPKVGHALSEAVSAISGTRILYEKLLHSDRAEQVSAQSYLTDLAESVLASFDSTARITLEHDIADVELDVRQVFPIGAILTELLTNTVKYAYPWGESGTARVRFTVNEDEHDRYAHLIVSDHGRGFSQPEAPAQPDASAHMEGFGLMIVRMLSEQLEGTFHMEPTPDGGATAHVRFPFDQDPTAAHSG